MRSFIHPNLTDRRPEEEKREERARKEREKQRKIEEKRQRDEEKQLREEEKRKSKSSPVGASIVLAKKAKETPAVEPAPTLEPISHPAPIATEEIVPAAKEDLAPTRAADRDATVIEEGPAPPREETEVMVIEDLEPIPVENSVPIAEEHIVPENVDMDTAEEIVERVFTAPVTTSSEEVKVPDSSSNLIDPSTQSEETKPSIAPASTKATRDSSTTKPVEQRVAPLVVATEATNQSPPTSPKQEHGTKLTSWLKNKLHRGSGSKSSKPTVEEAPKPLSESSKTTPTPTNSTTAPATSPLQTPRSVQEVAMAGKQHNPSMAAIPPRSRSRSTDISSLSSDEPTTLAHTSSQVEPVSAVEAETSRGRTKSQNLEKVSTVTSRDGEEFEEAKDHFDAEKLPVPSFPKERVAESPVRDSKFVEIL